MAVSSTSLIHHPGPLIGSFNTGPLAIGLLILLGFNITNTHEGDVEDEVDVDFPSAYDPILVQYLHQFIKNYYYSDCLVFYVFLLFFYHATKCPTIDLHIRKIITEVGGIE